MRNFLILGTFLSLASCLSESGVVPGSSKTFIRYYSGGNNDEARGMELTPDGGFIILASTRIQKAEADIPEYKVKLIKTDEKGIPVWQKLYPDIGVKDKNYLAAGIQIIPSGGYVVTGEAIQSSGPSKSLLLVVDDTGGVVSTTSYDYGKGVAVAVTNTGDYLILSSTGSNMYLLDINKTTYGSVTTSQYPMGTTTLTNRVLVDGADKAVWLGSTTASGLVGIRVVKSLPSNLNTEFDLLVSQPGFKLTGTDICPFGLNYAVTGSTDRKVGLANPANDTDIFVMAITSTGDTLATKSYSLDDPKTAANEDSQNDAGVSISPTNSGGLILLASVNSVAISGRGDTDYYLIKINPFGGTEWTSSFGSKFKDEGVSVRQTPDGGYAVLGTTTQGALKILSLLKTDKNGKIE